MTHKIFILTAAAVIALVSCSKGDDKVQYSYSWQLVQKENCPYDQPLEENLLLLEVQAQVKEFNEKYSGKGLFESDEEAVTASKFSEAEAALKTMRDEFLVRKEKFDNGNYSFDFGYSFQLSSSSASFTKATDVYEFSYTPATQYVSDSNVEVQFSIMTRPLVDNQGLAHFGLDADGISSISVDGALKIYKKETRELYEGDSSYITKYDVTKETGLSTHFSLEDKSRLSSIEGDWYVLIPVTIISTVSTKEHKAVLKLNYTIS